MRKNVPGTPMPSLKYNSQLDGLRFCAVLCVVCYHWLPSIYEQKISYFFGGLVNFFFVLSSYLITRILFSTQEKTKQMGASKITGLGVFLFRRTIRILPAYYFFLLVVMLLPKVGSEVKDHAGMYFGYLANYHIFQLPTWPPLTAHIWTLAVEEQFYLLWPLVIMFVPRKHLVKIFLSIIGISIVLKAWMYHQTTGAPQVILTQYALEPFAIGGLIAYKVHASEKEGREIGCWFDRLLFIAIPVGVLIIFSKSYYWSFVINGLVFSMVAMKLIEGAIHGYKGGLGKFLQHSKVRYLGKISYGIYLYHLLVPVIFWKLYNYGYGYLEAHFQSFYANHQGTIDELSKFLGSEAPCFVIYCLITILAASFSWIFIERPINELKSFFTVDKPQNFGLLKILRLGKQV